MHPVFLPSTAEDIQRTPPVMPMRTALKLTAGSEATMVQYALDRLGSAGQTYVAETGGGPWLQKRRRATQQFEGDMSFRAEDGIFKLSNKSFNAVKGALRTTAARIMDDLVGTAPFLAVVREGPEDDPDLAKDVERFAHWVLDEAEAVPTFQMAGRGALIRGEAVVKRRFSQSRCAWLSLREVAHTAGNVMIPDSQGKAVFRDDEFTPHETIAGAMVLARDPAVVLLEKDTRWLLLRVPESEMERKTEVSLVWYEDFFCETTARGVHIGETDFIAQTQDAPLHTIRQMLVGAENAEGAQRLLAQIRDHDQRTASAGEQPKEARGEEEKGADSVTVGHLAECYMTLDADGDGHAEEIVLIIEMGSRTPLFYDYLQNVCPDHKRPYEVLRAFPVENRWYGYGMYDWHSGMHEFLEILFNRVNVQGLKSGRIDFANPMACKETAAGEQLQFGTDKTYTLNDGYTKDDAFSSVVVPNLDEKALGLFQLCLQNIQVEMGNVTAGTGDLSGMPSTELATGIRSLERQGAILLKEMLLNLAAGVTKVSRGALAYAVYYMDAEMVFAIMEGAGQRVVQLQKASVKKLKYKLKLLLTKSRGEAALQMNEKALSVVERWLALITNPLTAMYAASQRPFYVEILKGLEVTAVEEALPMPMVPEVQGPMSQVSGMNGRDPSGNIRAPLELVNGGGKLNGSREAAAVV